MLTSLAILSFVVLMVQMLFSFVMIVVYAPLSHFYFKLGSR